MCLVSVDMQVSGAALHSETRLLSLRYHLTRLMWIKSSSIFRAVSLTLILDATTAQHNMSSNVSHTFTVLLFSTTWLNILVDSVLLLCLTNVM